MSEEKRVVECGKVVWLHRIKDFAGASGASTLRLIHSMTPEQLRKSGWRECGQNNGYWLACCKECKAKYVW